MDTDNYAEIRKKNNNRIIITALVCLVAGGLIAGGILIAVGQWGVKEPSDDSSAATEKVKEISDSELKEDLAIKTNMILSSGASLQSDASIYAKEPIDFEMLNRLTLEDKFRMALASDAEAADDGLTESQKSKITKDSIAKMRSDFTNAAADMTDEELLNGMTFLPLSKTMRINYQKMFGNIEEYPELVTDNLLYGCPVWRYLKELDGYVAWRGCGGYVVPTYSLFYQYKYEEGNGDAYVYVAAGTAKFTDNNYAVYRSLSGNETKFERVSPKSGSDDGQDFNLKVYSINEDNYKDFAHYRLVFKKGGANVYHYDSIEIAE